MRLSKFYLVLLLFVIGIAVYMYQLNGDTSVAGEKNAAMKNIPMSSRKPASVTEERAGEVRGQATQSFTDEELPVPVGRMPHIASDAEADYITDPMKDTLVPAPPIIGNAPSNGVEILEIPQPLSDKPLLVARQGGRDKSGDTGPIYAVNPLTGIQEELRPLNLKDALVEGSNKTPSPVTD